MSGKKSFSNNTKNNRFSLLNDDSDEDTKTIDNDQKPVEQVKKTIGIAALDKIENEAIKHFYGKKDYKKNNHGSNKYNNQNQDQNQNQNQIQNQNQNQEEGEFTIVSGKKKEKVDLEFRDLEENFLDLKMPNYFRILAHHNNDKNWDFLSYHNITTLNKWGDVPKFFNTLNKASGESSYSDFDIFIMKKDISPLWEDLDNRNGCLCQIKIDSLEDAYEILKAFTFNMLNNNLLKFTPGTWNIVNGLSFSPRKSDSNNINSVCVIIKIWFKINLINYGSADKILNEDMFKLVNKLSIKFKAIKPEY